MRWWSPVEEPHKALWSHLVLGLWCYVFGALLPRVLQQPHRTGVYVNSCLGVMTHCCCCCCCCTAAHSAPVYLSIPLEYIALDEAPCSTPVQYWRGSAQVGCIHNKMDLAYKSCANKPACCECTSCSENPRDANVSNKVPAPTNTPSASCTLFSFLRQHHPESTWLKERRPHICRTHQKATQQPAWEACRLVARVINV